MTKRLKLTAVQELRPGLFYVASTIGRDGIDSYTLSCPGDYQAATLKVTTLLLHENPGLFNWKLGEANQQDF